jgi:hypothetical protein
MSDMLSTGAAYLASTLAASASETVTYARPGGSLTTSWSATYGSQLLRVNDSKNVSRTLRTDRDFVGEKATLSTAGLWPPRRGDQVTMPTGEVFEVDAYGSEAHWRYADPFENLVRVHTKAQTL